MENDAYTRTGSADATDTAELNTLIGTLIDSIEGYQKAAADTENSRFAEMFNARAQERQQALTGLQAAVARLGGNPEDDGTTARPEPMPRGLRRGPTSSPRSALRWSKRSSATACT